jgi:RNA polymerase sigma-70 factor (ECF subfamily)
LAIDTSSLEDTTEEALVVAFQDGDNTAFTQIVETYYGVLFARARRQLRSSEDAQDAVQETFLRACRSLPTFAGDYRLAAWLNRILSNVIADAKRRHGMELRLHARLSGIRDVAPLPEEVLAIGPDDSEVRGTVERAIASLSAGHRQAFMLREVQDQSYAEIAEILDITEVNARARVHRARTNLQRTLRTSSGSMGVVLVSWRGKFTKLFSRHVQHGHATLPTRPFVPGSTSSSGFGVTQVVTQSLASPTGQALTTLASEAGRWALPSNVAVASFLATAAATVIAPATVLLAPMVGAPTPAAPAPHVVAVAPVASKSVLIPPSALDAASTQTLTPTPTTLPQTSTSTTTPDTSTANSAPVHSGTAKVSAASPWGWVGPASTAGAPAATAAGTPVGAATPPSSCPFLQSFPGASSTQVGLPPAATPNSPGASDYLSTGTMTLPTIGSSFNVSGQGILSNGSSSSTMQVLYGACGPSTSTPALLANVTNFAYPGSGELQLRGALVSSNTVGGETDMYYRGTAMWLSGPDKGELPVVFVADVMTSQPDNTAAFHAAFFGSVSDLLASSSPASTTTCAPISGSTCSVPSEAPDSTDPAGTLEPASS